MIADGQYVDGSWLLTVHIDDLDLDKQIRVQGDWSVAEVHGQLTQDLPPPLGKSNNLNGISLRSGTIRSGWSEYRLWWPAKCRWLLYNRLSLNQYGLQADALLRLVPIHGILCVQLPDLQTRTFVDVNYTEPVFRVTMSICRHLNIRHPEELSLAFPLAAEDMKRSHIIPVVIDRRQYVPGSTMKRGAFQRSTTVNTTHTQTKHLVPQNGAISSDEKVNHDAQIPPIGFTRRRSADVQHLFGPPRIRDRRPIARVSAHLAQTLKFGSPLFTTMNYSPGSMRTLAFEYRSLEDSSLACSPLIGVEDAANQGLLFHTSNFMHRLRLNSTWLDSAKSLMEQGIDVRLNKVCTTEQDSHLGSGTLKTDEKLNAKINGVDPDNMNMPKVVLRYKYGCFYDLNQKYDAVRINQLFEYAKWSVISEWLETTDDEACLLAALQAQVEIATELEDKIVTEKSMSSIPNDKDQIDSAEQMNGTNHQPKKPPVSESRIRDSSPIGGYLKHYQNPAATSTRPLSAIELDSQIDSMLEELSLIDAVDLSNIGGYRRSRLKKRSPRPLSQNFSSSVDDAPADPGPPSLKGYIKVCKPRKFGLKVFRKLHVSVDGLKLLVHKNEEDFESKTDAVEVIYLPGCEVQPDLCLITEKYCIRIFVPISRINLPLSAAFNVNNIDNGRGQEDDMGVTGRLKRRASLLSLTSLSHLGASLGFHSSNTQSGGLCGASANVLGLVNEILLRFNDPYTYTEWLALLRLTTALPCLGLYTGEDQPDQDGIVAPAEWNHILTKSVYEAERKAITGLIKLISPAAALAAKGDQVDSIVQVTAVHSRLETRFADFLPMRMSNVRTIFKGKENRPRDQPDATLARTANLPPDGRPPSHSSGPAVSTSQKNVIIRRISIAYSRIHELTSTQAKLKYISAWEQLPSHGIAYFPARIEITIPLSTLIGEDSANQQSSHGVPWMNRPLGGENVTVSRSRRMEAIGIGPTRIVRCELQTGEVIASWRLSAIHGWHINWELGELVLLLAPPLMKPSDDQRNTQSLAPARPVGRVIIRPVDVSVRVLAEFLGGYTFLNLRSPEKNQGLNEGVFYKLTTGSMLPFSYAGAIQAHPVHS